MKTLWIIEHRKKGTIKWFMREANFDGYVIKALFTYFVENSTGAYDFRLVRAQVDMTNRKTVQSTVPR